MDEEGLAEAKKNGGARGTLVFLDETGFNEGAVIRRTWAPRGQTPVLRPKGRHWNQASAIGALAYRSRGSRPRVFMRLHDGATHGEQIVRFLNHLTRHVRGRILVIWDRLNAHRSRVVNDWLLAHPRVMVAWLPPYAPELNPVEGLWSWLKGTELANVCEDTLAPILARARRGVRRVRRRSDLLRGFLEKSGLSF